MPFSPTSGIDRLSFLAHNDMYPGSQIDKTQYAVSSQYPTSAQAVVAGYDPRVNPLTGEQTQHMAKGGIASLASGGEIQAAYRQYLGRDPEEGAYAAWANADPGALIAGITGSQEYANRQASGGGGGIYAPDQPSGPITLMPVQGGGGGDIDALYRQYLGRNPDQGAYQTYAGWSPDQIRQAILGSQEFANRQASTVGGGLSAVNVNTGQSSGPATNQGGSDINALYQQYLGRSPDQGALQTYAGWSPDRIRDAILHSAEYASLHPSGSGPSAQDLASQVYGAYKTNANYDQALNQLNALPQNADYYRARIGLIGQMMGWQTGQNTGDRNSVYQKELESYIPSAKAAGLTDAEINSLINKNAAASSQENQRRIAEEAAKGQGWVNQNIPGGWGTVAGIAALAAAPYLAPELFGATAGADVTGIIGTDIASMTAAGATEAEITAALMNTYGLTPELAQSAMYQVAQGGAGALNAGIGGMAFDASNFVGPLVSEGGIDVAAADAAAASALAAQAGGGMTAAQILSNLKSAGAAVGTATTLAKMAGVIPSTVAGVAKGVSSLLPTGTKTGTTGTGTTGGTTGTTGTGGLNLTSLNLGSNAPTTQNVPLFQVGTPSALAGASSIAHGYNPVATPVQQIASASQPDVYQPEYDFEFAKGGIARLSSGGDLGGYSDGGRLLKGPGDGVSDSIPASIGQKQPARLAEGEFVLPSRIVSEIGNGSTDAGAKRLYAMMHRIQQRRSKSMGKDKVATDTKAYKELDKL